MDNHDDQLLDQVIEAIVFMIDAGLGTKRLDDPAAVANFAKAAVLIGKARNAEDWLVRAAGHWVTNGNRFAPSAPELVALAVRLKKESIITIGIDASVPGTGEHIVAVMPVDKEKWQKATDAQKEAKKASFCKEKGIVRSLPTHVSNFKLQLGGKDATGTGN